MNNKGQTLVAFLLMVPILCIFCGFIFDIGLCNTERRRMENVVKDTISYGLNHMEDENIRKNMEVLLNQNLEDRINTKITIEEEKIEILVTKKQKSIYSILAGENMYTLKVHYVGYQMNEEIKIVKR